MKIKNNEVGMVSECKPVILRSKFVETRFWRLQAHEEQQHCLAHLSE